MVFNRKSIFKRKSAMRNIILTIVLMLLCVASASSQVEFLYSFGSEGTAPGQFTGPHGIALDDQGNIYVSEFCGNRVQVFDNDGEFQSFLGTGNSGSGAGDFDGAVEIEIANDGTIYVGDRRNDRVQVFESDGSVRFAFDTGDIPNGVAVANNGDIYVTNLFPARVEVFDNTGTSQFSFSHSFDGPRFVELDDAENVYVSDSLASRVQVFDDAGNYQFQFGSEGTGPGQFNRVYGLAFDSFGNLYAADRGNDRRQVFDHDGNYLFEFANGMVESPDGIAIHEGQIYVADHGNDRVAVWGIVPDADFDHDGTIDCADVDSLVMEIVDGTDSYNFDLTGDGLVDNADLDEWLVLGGAANLPSGNPYLVGDANLNDVVDGLDYIEWNAHKFTSTAAWCSGDFNADGAVDGLDFVLWNANKFTSSDSVSAVPEPGMGVFLIAALISLVVVRRR
jgi:hypothetical protein